MTGACSRKLILDLIALSVKNFLFFISAVFFLEFWKRTSARLSHHWDVMNFEEEEERPRPEYNARAPTLEVNPITGVREPHFPPEQRTKRVFTGFTILIIMVSRS